MSIRLDTVPALADGQADRQTDIQTDRSAYNNIFFDDLAAA